MNKCLIDFNDLIEKPKFTYLVGSGSLFVSQLEDGYIIKAKIEFSEEKNNFSEYFYKFDENKSCVLVKINKDEATLPLLLTLYNKNTESKNKVIKLYDSQNFSIFSPYKLEYDKNNFKFTINPNTNELYAVIDVTI